MVDHGRHWIILTLAGFNNSSSPTPISARMAASMAWTNGSSDVNSPSLEGFDQPTDWRASFASSITAWRNPFSLSLSFSAISRRDHERLVEIFHFRGRTTVKANVIVVDIDSSNTTNNNDFMMLLQLQLQLLILFLLLILMLLEEEQKERVVIVNPNDGRSCAQSSKKGLQYPIVTDILLKGTMTALLSW